MRTKLRVFAIESALLSRKAPDGKFESVKGMTVKLCAVTDGSDENRMFGDATPQARLEMTITNEAAAEMFQQRLGEMVYVTFEPAGA